eukprot:GDKI01002790.1.p1 GENE.GDKI01002790.1~~GDKI01002790.1.p1  ORF type:complete len:120 (+),score=13.67 GDKI01002790.1:179-538(+)
MTPLHWAASSGCATICRLLIESGADVHALNRIHQTPLHSAAHKGDTDICQMLIERGADVNIRDQTHWQRTPLDWAADPATCQLLIERGADRAGVSVCRVVFSVFLGVLVFCLCVFLFFG